MLQSMGSQRAELVTEQQQTPRWLYYLFILPTSGLSLLFTQSCPDASTFLWLNLVPQKQRTNHVHISVYQPLGVSSSQKMVLMVNSHWLYRAIFLISVSSLFTDLYVFVVCVCVCVCVLSPSDVWLFMTPMDGSPPGSSVYGIFQARLLEWIVISSSRGSCRPRGQTCISWVSCIDRQILYHCSSWEPLLTTWIEMIYFLKNLILVFALLSPHPNPPHLSILNT